MRSLTSKLVIFYQLIRRPRPDRGGWNEVSYVSGVYYSSLAPSNAPGGYEYHQQWSSNSGYENVGILLRSNDGQYQNSIYGGSGDDTILGNSGVDEIVGRDGNDLIMGAGGDDSLMGLAGDDTIVAGYSMAANSDSFLNTWKGLFSDSNMTDAQVAAQFNTKSGNATLYGGDGNDLLVSGSGTDELHGGNAGKAMILLNPPEAGKQIMAVPGMTS